MESTGDTNFWLIYLRTTWQTMLQMTCRWHCGWHRSSATSSAERCGEISGRKLCTDDICHLHVIRILLSAMSSTMSSAAGHLCIKPTGILVSLFLYFCRCLSSVPLCRWLSLSLEYLSFLTVFGENCLAPTFLVSIYLSVYLLVSKNSYHPKASVLWLSVCIAMPLSLSIGGFKAGVDPGFPVGGGANHPGERQHIKLPNFPKNCMKLRNFWTVGGARPLHPSK